MNKEEYFKRMINRICKDYGYDVATAFEGLYLEKNKEIEKLKVINEEHKKLNGELREENQKYKEVIDKVLKLIDNYMYENYCYVGSEDKLKDILKKVESDE